MGPDGVHLFHEDPVRAKQGLHGHRRGYIGGLQQELEVCERKYQHPQHPVGAVDQGKTLFGP
jgi:hypothetical protein